LYYILNAPTFHDHVVYTDTRILSIVPPNIPKPSLVARRHLLRDEGMGRKKCEHGRRRSGCKDCGDGGPVIFLEATEVEEFDGEEVPDEWVPTVPALVVGGPRGGRKRKR
jgi:hypothetical protein